MKLVRLIAIALVAAGSALADGAAPAKSPSDAVKVKIAALDHDGAKAALKELEAQAKSKEAKAEAKALEKEVSFISRIEPLVKKVQKLLDDGKARAAYESGMAGVDQFPGAIALAALMVPTRKAREQCCLVIDDFDDTTVPATLTEGERGKDKMSRIGELQVGNSKVQSVADPMGGKAVHWTWDSLPGDQYAQIGWALSSMGTDLSQFDFLSVRVKAIRPPSKPLEFLFLSSQHSDDNAVTHAPVGAGTGWHEIRVPLDKLRNSGPGKFDPRKATGFFLDGLGTGPVDLMVDEIVLMRKGK